MKTKHKILIIIMCFLCQFMQTVSKAGGDPEVSVDASNETAIEHLIINRDVFEEVNPDPAVDISEYSVSENGEIRGSVVSAYIPTAIIYWAENTEGNMQEFTKFQLSDIVLPYNVDTYIEETDEIELFYKLVQAEAGTQSSLGRRLVADCVLNQVASEDFPNTIKDIICLPNNFEVVSTGYIFVTQPSETTIKCVDLELESQIDYGVMYFRTEHFHTFGVPYEQVGAHYFSKSNEDNPDEWGAAVGEASVAVNGQSEN